MSTLDELVKQIEEERRKAALGLDKAPNHDDLLALLDEMDELYGKPTEEDDAWARRVLGL